MLGKKSEKIDVRVRGKCSSPDCPVTLIADAHTAGAEVRSRDGITHACNG